MCWLLCLVDFRFLIGWMFFMIGWLFCFVIGCRFCHVIGWCLVHLEPVVVFLYEEEGGQGGRKDLT